MPPMNEFPDSMRDRNVCVMGLGYVGLTLAVAMADVGFNVHGVEFERMSYAISCMGSLISMSPASPAALREC